MGYADLMSSQGLVIPTIGVGAGPLCVIFAYERRNSPAKGTPQINPRIKRWLTALFIFLIRNGN
jgi:hypothetical protein